MSIMTLAVNYIYIYFINNKSDQTNMETTKGLRVSPGHRQALELELVKLKEQTEEMEQQLTDAQQVPYPYNDNRNRKKTQKPCQNRGIFFFFFCVGLFFFGPNCF